MKKTIITTSILALFASVSLAETNITSGGEYTYTNNTEMGYIRLNYDYPYNGNIPETHQAITNSDFSGSTFNSGSERFIRMNSNTKLADTSFKGCTIKNTSSTQYGISVDGRWDRVRPIVENVDFSNTTWDVGIAGFFYQTDLNNVSFNGANIKLNFNEGVDVATFWISMCNASNFDFRNTNVTNGTSNSIITVSGSKTPGSTCTISNFDFRGATINGELYDTKHINL